MYLGNNLKLQELETRLNKFTYLSKEPLPGRSDALIFEAIKLSRSKFDVTKKSHQRHNISTSTIGILLCHNLPQRKL